jgi:hypothetical protein
MVDIVDYLEYSNSIGIFFKLHQICRYNYYRLIGKLWTSAQAKDTTAKHESFAPYCLLLCQIYKDIGSDDLIDVTAKLLSHV